MPRINHGLNGFAIFYFLISLSLALSVHTDLPREVIHQLLMAATLPTGIFLAFITIQSMSKGDLSAKYLLLAFGVLWIGGSVAALRALGFVPTNAITAYALQIGSVFEILLLSFALANQIHVERKLRHSAESLHEQYVRFSSLISHEFRTPLNVIESQAALLEREHDNSLANIKKRTHVIMSAVQQLSFLFTRWAQADRLKQAMNQINPSAIDLYVWLGRVVDRCRDFYPNHPIHLEIDPETQTIWADDELLQIQVGTIIQNDMTGIYVTDHGKGIATEQHENIFDAYTRLDNHTTTPGIGLGLAFVKKIMALHGGRVDLSSRLGAGSRFVLWFSNQRGR
jgi:signal transduction histidine kinase